MLERAKELQAKQVSARGLVDYKGLDGKKIKVIGPYEPTMEHELWAAEIIALRKAAARA